MNMSTADQRYKILRYNRLGELDVPSAQHSVSFSKPCVAGADVSQTLLLGQQSPESDRNSANRLLAEQHHVKVYLGPVPRPCLDPHHSSDSLNIHQGQETSRHLYLQIGATRMH